MTPAYDSQVQQADAEKKSCRRSRQSACPLSAVAAQ
jgi:hypothetical protein